VGGGAADIRRMQHADVKGRSVLVRVDYNVPLHEEKIADDGRLRASLPTLTALLDGGAKLILVTHLGRPGGRPVPALRLDPVSDRLSELIGRPVYKMPDCIGDEVAQAVKEGHPGDVFLLENVRFHSGEEANDDAFARALASVADVFINDAFATVHRAHASTLGVAKLLPSYAGLLMQREIDTLSRLLDSPARPYIAIVGGRKAQSKLGALRDLVSRVDALLIGGGVAFTFLRAVGASVGDSLVDEEALGGIAEIIQAASKRGVEIVLPSDACLARQLESDSETLVGDAHNIPDGWAAFDIGPDTVRRFRERIEAAKTLVWTGPMGAFELEPFAAGTIRIAEAVADSDAFSVIGGGETGEAIARFGFADDVSYISTGGGACLAILRGQQPAALEALRG
jgi:phosphoglycerate kinase